MGDVGRPWLLQEMEKVPSMIQPWDEKKSELRAHDVPAKNFAEFSAFLKKYDENSGLPYKSQRFRKLANGNGLYHSKKVKLGFNTRPALQEALLNYMGHAVKYSINPLKSQTTYMVMCQTFASDLFNYLTRSTQGVYSPVAKPFYKFHMHWFLYLPQYTEAMQE